MYINGGSFKHYIMHYCFFMMLIKVLPSVCAGWSLEERIMHTNKQSAFVADNAPCPNVVEMCTVLRLAIQINNTALPGDQNTSITDYTHFH